MPNNSLDRSAGQRTLKTRDLMLVQLIPAPGQLKRYAVSINADRRNSMTTFYGLVGLLIVFAGGSLLFYLGAGRVPPPIMPIANVWVRAGYDPKWITVAMWTTVAIMALVFFLFIGIPLYHAAVDLGTPRR